MIVDQSDVSTLALITEWERLTELWLLYVVG